jgi:hypothetical protein
LMVSRDGRKRFLVSTSESLRTHDGNPGSTIQVAQY